MLTHSTTHHRTIFLRIGGGIMALMALWFGNVWLLVGCVVVLVFLHAYEVFAMTALFDTLYSSMSDRHEWVLTIFALLFAVVVTLGRRYVRPGGIPATP